MPEANFLESVRELSDRLIKLQAPIRILDSINWDGQIRQQFFKHKFKRQPDVTADYYLKKPLAYDPQGLRSELTALEREVTQRIGQLNPIGVMMRRMCREFRLVVRMLEARGQPEFNDLSVELYGSPHDVFHAGDPSLAELGLMLEQTVSSLLKSEVLQEEQATIPADEAVRILDGKLKKSMSGTPVNVTLSDGIVSDAAAGSDYIKLNKDSLFSMRDLEILEVHEGWVHVGTTQNGLAQPYMTFMAKGTPSATVTQEGLAVLTEIITLRSTPKRLDRLVNRIRAVTLAQDGATFLDVFNYLREKGTDADDAYGIAARVFRGSTPEGGPFTKDLSYIKGFVLVYNFIRVAIQLGRIDRLPLLMAGKISLEDFKSISELSDQGVLKTPHFVPPHFQDLRGLASWLSFGKFIGLLSFNQLEQDYRPLF